MFLLAKTPKVIRFIHKNIKNPQIKNTKIAGKAIIITQNTIKHIQNALIIKIFKKINLELL